jgi:hypothetical protein
MGDTGNWELAAAVAGVCIGLGGLVLLATISIVGSWRVFQQATRAAEAAEAAADATRQLAAQLALRPAEALDRLAEAAGTLGAAGEQTAALVERQARLQQAVQTLVEAAALGGEPARQEHIDAALKRMERTLERIASKVEASDAPRA